MTGEGPTLEVLHTFCLTQETSANTKKAVDTHAYNHTHTHTPPKTGLAFSELSDTL